MFCGRCTGRHKDPRAVDPLIEALKDDGSYMWAGQFATKVSESAQAALVEIALPGRRSLIVAAASGSGGATKLARKGLQEIDARYGKA